MADWEKDIKTALSLGVQHISAYSLMYEEGTTLTRMLLAGEIEEIDEELSLQMFRTLVERLKKAGFEHYEITNFALLGKRSRHNSSYWHGIPYYGFGAGAHSYDGNRRTWNVENLHLYIKGVETTQLATEGETLTLEQKYDECVMVGLRTCEGVDLDAIQKEFGKESLAYLLENAQPHLDAGKLCIEQNRIHLTEDGIYTSNDIISDLMRV
jgi:oxygen-independent coproporphyrinogen-3 oxidase